MSTSKSSPTNTTSTNTTLQTTNENVSGNSGLTNLGGDVNYSTRTDTTAIDASTHLTTDFGAVQAGTALSQHALDTVAAANRYGISTVGDIAAASINAASDSEARIASIAGNAQSSVSNAFGSALTTVQHNTDNTVSVVQNLASLFGSALQTEFEDTQKQLGNVVSALNSTYTANNTSANQQVINAVSAAGEQSSAVIKYVAFAAVAGVVLFLVLRK